MTEKEILLHLASYANARIAAASLSGDKSKIDAILERAMHISSITLRGTLGEILTQEEWKTIKDFLEEREAQKYILQRRFSREQYRKIARLP
jgi:hypothetical protein